MENSTVERAAIGAAQSTWSDRFGTSVAVKIPAHTVMVWHGKGLHYVEFKSKRLDCDVRIGYAIDDDAEFADPQLREVCIGGADLTVELADGALDALGDELCDAVRELGAGADLLAQEQRAEARADAEAVS